MGRACVNEGSRHIPAIVAAEAKRQRSEVGSIEHGDIATPVSYERAVPSEAYINEESCDIAAVVDGIEVNVKLICDRGIEHGETPRHDSRGATYKQK
jgi:hypothetical protein